MTGSPLTWPAVAAGGALFHGSAIVLGVGLASPTAWAITCALEAAGILAAHTHGRADARQQLAVDQLRTDPFEPQPALANSLTRGPADGHTGWLAAATIVAPLQGATYLTSWHATRNGADVGQAARQFAAQARSAFDASTAPKAERVIPDEATPPTVTEPDYPQTTPPARAGAVLGWDRFGNLVRASARTSALVIGPPGQGKTQGVINPNVALAPGPCVTTNIKSEVFIDTLDSRVMQGKCWVFDPSGSIPDQENLTAVHWSPLDGVYDWDAAKSMAASMAAAIDNEADNKNQHFTDHARNLLAVMLYAASYDGIESLVRWLRRPARPTNLPEIKKVLTENNVEFGGEAAAIATDSLESIMEDTGTNERGSILSTMKRLCEVYESVGGLRVARGNNFSVKDFVSSEADTLYIIVPQDRVKIYGPNVVALLTAIYNARTRIWNDNKAAGTPQPVPLTMVLDEVANTAPVPLPQWVSQAGGQGVHLIASVQDMSQARDMYGDNKGTGLLTIQGDKLLLPGIIDPGTLSAISSVAGEFDQHTINQTINEHGHATYTFGERNRERLPESRIAQMPEGQALHVQGARPQFVRALAWWNDTERSTLTHAVQMGA